MNPPLTFPQRRSFLVLLVAGLIPTGCGDPGAGTVTPDASKEGGPSRLKRLEQLKDEVANKKKKGSH